MFILMNFIDLKLYFAGVGVGGGTGSGGGRVGGPGGVGGGSTGGGGGGGEGRVGAEEGEELGLIYDSDSSLTMAANKTLSLSTSLSQQCGMDLRSAHHNHSSSSTPYHHHHSHHHSFLHHSHLLHGSGGRQSRALDRTHARSDSDGSDRSHDKLRHRHCSHEHGLWWIHVTKIVTCTE